MDHKIFRKVDNLVQIFRHFPFGWEKNESHHPFKTWDEKIENDKNWITKFLEKLITWFKFAVIFPLANKKMSKWKTEIEKSKILKM